MAGSVADLKATLSGLGDAVAKDIAERYDSWNRQRAAKVAEWQELRNYIFATDTSTTTNSALPWKNRTTLPKLAQLRDNLHSNYISSLFPNDNWMKWEGASSDDDIREKAEAITAYMQNKLIEGRARNEVSQLVLDYIDYGNAFATVEYESNIYESADGTQTEGYSGPVIVRISPLDIVFNPLASSFEKSPKIIRKLITIGEMQLMAQSDETWQLALDKAQGLRHSTTGYSVADFNKATALSVDGFGSYLEYLGSNYVEVLTFYGDLYNPQTGTVETNRKIVIVDRRFTVSNGKIDNWLGRSIISHVGWRKRPDNLYSMGPLDNLVGMQYRLDHLENIKADAMDIAIHPPLAIVGDVDPFTWAPGVKILLGEGGSVTELGKNIQGAMAANNEIEVIINRMELMAGAPRDAMGVRTPGEKTAFEVQTLDNAAGRIFQEKVVNFETELLEPLLQAMLAIGRQHLDVAQVRYFDDDLGVEGFLTITKEDITAKGSLRPVGARHFSQQAQVLQSLAQAFQSGFGEKIAPHFSGKNLAKLIEDNLQISRYDLVRPNIAVIEMQETQQLAGQAQEDSEAEMGVPVPGEGVQ